MKGKVDIKIAVILGVIGFLALVTLGYFLTKEKAPPEEIKIVKNVTPTTPVPKKIETKAAYAWSTNTDESLAAEEIANTLKNRLTEEPDFIFLFATVDYDVNKLINEIKKRLPNTKIYGGTSCLAVLTPDGYIKGEAGSVAALGVKSKDITFGVGYASLDNMTAREAGRKAILNAIANAGNPSGKPKIIFMTAAPGQEEEIIAGIEEVVGSDVPIFGGSSGDNDISGKWKQFANDKVLSNGVALAVMYTDLTIGYAYEAGYIITKYRGTITRGEGRVIYEIDGRPAAEVYNEWTNGLISEELEKGGRVWGIIEKATFYPIAKVLTTKEGKLFYLAMHPLAVNATDKSISVFANVNTGDKVALMIGDWEILLNRFYTTPRLAMATFDIERNEPIFAIYTFCAGTMLVIPEDEREKMSLLIKEAIGENVPFVGTFTFGEQGHVPEIGNLHGNLVNSIVMITS